MDVTGALWGFSGLGFMFLLFSLLFLFVFGGIILWILMIIDCAKRVFPPGKEDQKIVWIIVMALTGWLGALIYLFAVCLGNPRKV